MQHRIPIYQVDAFTLGHQRFTGNPAAVCPLEDWLPDPLLQNIALENNLSETAFFVRQKDGFHLRWFTPACEVDLCGHATLATAHVIFTELGAQSARIRFESLSGPLFVTRREPGQYTLDFPVDRIVQIKNDHPVGAFFSKTPQEVWQGSSDFLLLYPEKSSVEQIEVDYRGLGKYHGRGVLVTAAGDSVDYVARCFFPQAGIDEDPATGSSQTTLAPFWSPRLKKHQFTARQLSPRGAAFETELSTNRVLITGNAVSFMSGFISV